MILPAGFSIWTFGNVRVNEELLLTFMKIGFQTLLPLFIGVSLMQTGCAVQSRKGAPSNASTKSAPDAKPAAATQAPPAAKAATETPPPAPASPSALTNTADRVGYAIGMNVGNNLKRANFDINLDELTRGIRDVLAGQEPKMTEAQAREAIMSYEQQRQHELAETNLKEGREFLEKNKTQEGVKVLPVTLPDGSTAELQYKIITQGTGEIPKSNDTVTVNYRGTLINGTEFDSSAKHGGRPARFVVNHVIRGWTEALEMMPEGSKWQLFIPSSLAYGDRASATIPPGSTLIFDVELVSIEKPKPLTSDIIRVPSAEEMKAGAKIEVIKAEDAEKMAASKTNKAAPENK